MKAGVDEIGADLERLDDEATATKRLEKAERHGGLADTARNTSHDEHPGRRMSHRSVSSREDRYGVDSPGQVSWLSDRPTPRAFPARTLVALAGFVPDYSDGVAADSHRLPWGPLARGTRAQTAPGA